MKIRTLLAITRQPIGTECQSDIVRLWLKERGRDWGYDHFGRIVFDVDERKYTPDCEFIGNDLMRIYVIPV